MPEIARHSGKVMTQLYETRHHLTNPVPHPIYYKTTGNVLPESKWEKFCESLANKRLLGYCEKKSDALYFYGEYGLDAAVLLQKKYPGRFHFILYCDSEDHVKEGLGMAAAGGLKISEIEYLNTRHTVTISDPTVITTMMRAQT